MAIVSRGEQRLLLEILEKGNVTLDSQKTFDSKKFFVAINRLIKNNFAKKTDGKYTLTLNGEIFSLQLRDYKK